MTEEGNSWLLYNVRIAYPSSLYCVLTSCIVMDIWNHSTPSPDSAQYSLIHGIATAILLESDAPKCRVYPKTPTQAFNSPFCASSRICLRVCVTASLADPAMAAALA